MRCILGIGNPGREYEGTRHNCGFLVVDELARRHGVGDWRKAWSSLAAEWRAPESLGGERVLLLKPQTFVNLSGGAAQAAMAFHKFTPAELLVVVDDINLPLGTLRLRPSGSAGGHNGLKDIEARIGPEYPRLRVGIGRPAHAAAQVGHVLGRFDAEEQADVATMLAKAAACCEAWLRDGVVVACRFNGPLHPPPPRPPRTAPPPAAEAREPSPPSGAAGADDTQR